MIDYVAVMAYAFTWLSKHFTLGHFIFNPTYHLCVAISSLCCTKSHIHQRARSPTLPEKEKIGIKESNKASFVPSY